VEKIEGNCPVIIIHINKYFSLSSNIGDIFSSVSKYKMGGESSIAQGKTVQKRKSFLLLHGKDRISEEN
jgi:hypothetical protein